MNLIPSDSSKLHFLTLEVRRQTYNIVVEIPAEKLEQWVNLDAKTRQERQSDLAFDLACHVLTRTGHAVGIMTQIYNREIVRETFEAPLANPIVFADRSKGWIVSHSDAGPMASE